jgi:hypothetical protein
MLCPFLRCHDNGDIAYMRRELLVDPCHRLVEKQFRGLSLGPRKVVIE